MAQYAIDEDPAMVRKNISREFRKHSANNVDPKIINMLVFKGQVRICTHFASSKTCCQLRCRLGLLKCG